MAQPPEDGRARDILERGSSNQRPVRQITLVVRQITLVIE